MRRKGARKKIAFLADTSAKGSLGGGSPSAKQCDLKKKNALNVLKQKNMQKYLMKFLQGDPLETSKYFLKILKYF